MPQPSPAAVLSEARPRSRPALRTAARLPAAARHVISRLSFGQTPALIEEVRNGGVEAFVRAQLDPGSIDDTACEAELAAFSRLYRPARELVDSGQGYPLRNELVGMSVVRAVRSRRQLLEVMVDFWSNHFSVNSRKRQIAYLLPGDNMTVRRLALRRFDELLVATAKSPSMLTFLDNRTSRADTRRPPNENFARELLELHTFGDASSFSEADVAALAHVFTGWTIDTGSWTFRFRAGWNRLGPAADRDTLGWRPPAGGGSIANGESVLAHLAHHPLTARNVCWKLCRHFIRDGIGRDDPIVARVARSYLANDTDIARTLATLFASEAFRTSANARVKRPNELLHSMLRASGATLQLHDVQRFGRQIKEELVRLDQVTFEATSPKGHAFEDEAWMDASALINRWNLAFRVGANRVVGTDIDIGSFADGARDAGQFVDAIAVRLSGAPLPEAERRRVLEHLAANAADPIDRRMRLRLPAVVGLTLASPSFQTR